MNENNQDTVIVDVAIFYSEFNSTGDQYRKNDKCRCSINRNAKKFVQLMPGYQARDLTFLSYMRTFL